MSENKEKKPGKIKQSLTNRRFKAGIYQSIITVVVIVAIIIVNMIVTKMDISKDLSSDEKFTLTDETKELVNNMGDSVTLYYMCQEGNENTYVKKVLDQYDKLSSVKLVTKDPVQYPTFAATYTSDEVQDNDVIVVNDNNEKKSKLVSIDDMYPSEMDYETYSTVNNTLDAEGQITAAIQAVTSVDAKKLYVTKGHGEQALGTELTDMLSKSNIEVTETRTDSLKEMPKDCDYLMINGPTNDFTESEATIIKSYLENGGRAILTLNAQASDAKMTNYYGLAAYYGAQVQQGFACEDQSHALSNNGQVYMNYIKATLGTTTITDGMTEDKPIIAINSKGLKQISDLRGTLTLESVLSTSDNSFSRVSTSETSTNKVSGDVDGPFDLVIAATDTFKGTTTKVIVMGSYILGDDSIMTYDQYNNRTFMLNAVNYLSDEATSSLAIPSRSLQATTVEVPDSDRVFWIATLVVCIPVFLLGAGFLIWFVRRRS